MPADSFELSGQRPFGIVKIDLENIPWQMRQLVEEVLLQSGKLLELGDNKVGIGPDSICRQQNGLPLPEHFFAVINVPASVQVVTGVLVCNVHGFLAVMLDEVVHHDKVLRAAKHPTDAVHPRADDLALGVPSIIGRAGEGVEEACQFRDDLAERSFLRPR